MGALFGEISMIKKCKRTASVVAKNFATIAVLTFEKFKEIDE